MKPVANLKTHPSTRDLLSLAHKVPCIDLRAPGEFAQGAFPGAVNLPLLTDNERAEVGIAYKNRGRQAAVEVGQAANEACEEVHSGLRETLDPLISDLEAPTDRLVEGAVELSLSRPCLKLRQK